MLFARDIVAGCPRKAQPQRTGRFNRLHEHAADIAIDLETSRVDGWVSTALG